MEIPIPSSPVSPPPEPATFELSLDGVLRALDDGLFYDELEHKLNALVRGVSDYGKAGKLTITLDVKPAGRTVEILSEIRPKQPEAPRSPAIFFALPDGHLSRKDPKQSEFAFPNQD